MGHWGKEVPKRIKEAYQGHLAGDLHAELLHRFVCRQLAVLVQRLGDAGVALVRLLGGDLNHVGRLLGVQLEPALARGQAAHFNGQQDLLGGRAHIQHGVARESQPASIHVTI